MKMELIISLIALIASIVIGIIQIRISRKQKSSDNRINILERKITQIGNGSHGIIGNSNNGNISNNKF
jgi:hypothetical protein